MKAHREVDDDVGFQRDNLRPKSLLGGMNRDFAKLVLGIEMEDRQQQDARRNDKQPIKVGSVAWRRSPTSALSRGVTTLPVSPQGCALQLSPQLGSHGHPEALSLTTLGLVIRLLPKAYAPC